MSHKPDSNSVAVCHVHKHMDMKKKLCEEVVKVTDRGILEPAASFFLPKLMKFFA